MKCLSHILAIVAGLLLSAGPVYAEESRTKDVDITVTLSRDGGALVREVWDIDIYRGTEWYLVRDNLGDIVVSGLSVEDETGRRYVDEGSWDVNRSIGEKAGRCGIVRKRDGCEICWGLGSYGPHRFVAEYRMSNVVKSMDDYDCLHMQLVSPGISPRPENVRVRIISEDYALDDSNCGIWAFGYNGDINFAAGGGIVASTAEPFLSDEYSVIVLVRFDKGLFASGSRLDGSFQSKLDEAFKGSSYKEYNDRQRRQKGLFAALAVSLMALMTAGGIRAVRKRNEKVFGVRKLKEIGYERDIPFGGNLFETGYVLSKINIGYEENIAGALILKMARDGILDITNDGKGKVVIGFSGRNTDGLNESEQEFLGFLVESAGDDGILVNREFTRWARRHEDEISSWVQGLKEAGKKELVNDSYLSGTVFSDEGKMQARRAVGFRKFLKDFTLIDERRSVEVSLWRDYLVFAALYGVADKVAKELKEINPKAFETYVGYDYPTVRGVLVYSNGVSRDITRAFQHQTTSSVGGHGGFSSFGGGGGFSGGGFGGGAR